MKFTTAWSDISNQNVILKTALVSLCFCSVSFAIVSMKLSMREPLIVERECFSRILKTENPKRTTEEVEAFVKEALQQRFDSELKPSPAFLSLPEIMSKQQEQKTLDEKRLRQKIVVNSIKIDGSSAFVEADRLLAVGTIRSALQLNLTLKIESQSRDKINPYGLVLAETKLTEKK